jgi:hypothetical protein
MKFYKAYNLCIASELQLPELIETEGEPDVIVRFGKVENASAMQHDGGQNFMGEIPEVAEFFIHDGRQIVINPVAGCGRGSSSHCTSRTCIMRTAATKGSVSSTC